MDKKEKPLKFQRLIRSVYAVDRTGKCDLCPSDTPGLMFELICKIGFGLFRRYRMCRAMPILCNRTVKLQNMSAVFVFVFLHIHAPFRSLS